MAAKCDNVDKEVCKLGDNINQKIPQKLYDINKEMDKKCDDTDKKIVGNREYKEKKFGFSRVQWVIKNHCVSSPLKDKTFYSPEFYVKGFHTTKWVMSVKRFCSGGRNIVKFFLKRLNCAPFRGMVTADCILEYSDHHGETIETEFSEIFGSNMMSCVEQDMQFAGIIPLDDYHSHEFKLKLEILIYFQGIKERIPLCQNLGIRRLSEDLHHLYEEGFKFDLELKLQANKKVKTHKVILLNRIRSETFKRKVTPGAEEITLDDFVFEPVEKVIRFLYTSNLQYTLDPDPSIAVFKFAELLDVKPIIAYYNPNEIYFTSNIDVEEFSTTWTIEEFCNRKDYFLQSPTMTNKMRDMKWRIILYPRGFLKGDYLDIVLDYEVQEKSKEACVELFLQSRPKGRISFICHKRLCEKGKLKTKKLIRIDEVLNNYIRDDSLTIGLQLRMCNGKESASISESKAIYKHFSEQENYEQLSQDILSTYLRGEHAYLRRDVRLKYITLSVHEWIIDARCVSLWDTLTKNPQYFDNKKIAVIYEIINFVYSGKLREHYSLDDIFLLCEEAAALNFENLKNVIIEKLFKILCSENARSIHQFAVEQGIQYLRDSAVLLF